MEEVGRRGGERWLELLRQQPYEDAKAELQQLPGVGSKVRDPVLDTRMSMCDVTVEPLKKEPSIRDTWFCPILILLVYVSPG